jgi:glutathione S-transferase
MAPARKKSKKAGPEYVIHYWPAKGRAEAIRLTFVLSGLEYKEQFVTDESEVETKKKAGTAESPFGQWPLLVEGDTVLCQTQAIMKHIGRAHGMYGSRNKMEDYLVDSCMLGTDALRAKFSDMVWVHGNTAEAREKFEKQQLDPETKLGVNGGAHLSYLEGFLERSETQWMASGKNLSVADISLFDLFDSLSESFGAEKLAKLYPKCAAHHKTFTEIEEIAEYLKSDKRHKA